MSLFLSFIIHGSRRVLPRLMSSILIRFFMVILVCAEVCHGQLSELDLLKLRKQFTEGGDAHSISLAVGSWEKHYRCASEDQKLFFIKEVINLSSLVFEACDSSLHPFLGIGPSPNFDWQKYGIKPLFSGVSPDTIEHPEAKAAYKKALAEHQALLVRVSNERSKLEEGESCARVSVRVLESSSNQEQLADIIATYIATIKTPQWIRERLLGIILPQKVLKKAHPAPEKNDRAAAPEMCQHGVIMYSAWGHICIFNK